MLLNAVQRKPLYKIGIFSAPGKGKTHIGATAPDPLILLFERHGFETVRTACKMNGREMPPVIWVRSVKQLSRIQTILASDPKEPIATMMRDGEVVSEEELMSLNIDREDLVDSLPYTKPKTVVLDSTTEACEMIAEIIDANGGTEKKNGLTYRKLKAWGPIKDKCTRMLRSFRDLPYHVLFIALLDERNNGTEDEADMHYAPDLPGQKLWKVLVASVNAMGLLCMRHGRNKKGDIITQRWVQFISPDHIATKVASPLRDREPADAGAWFAALEHGVKNTSTAEQLASMGVDLPDLDGDEQEEAGEEE